MVATSQLAALGRTPPVHFPDPRDAPDRPDGGVRQIPLFARHLVGSQGTVHTPISSSWDVSHGHERLRNTHERYGSANTKMLLPLLGRSSGVIALQREALPPVPVPATTYWRPSTA